MNFSWDDFFVKSVVVDVARNVLLKLVGQASPLTEIQHSIKFDLEVVSSYIDLIKDRLEISNGV